MAQKGVPGRVFSGCGHWLGDVLFRERRSQIAIPVCITAIETGLIGTFELHVRSDLTLEWPLAETSTHVITMAFDPDLDDAVVIALREMIKLICVRTGISREDAYTLCSLAADLRVTQVVNGSKGIHVMLEKQYLRSAAGAAC
jgi:acetamidase/formamidase